MPGLDCLSVNLRLMIRLWARNDHARMRAVVLVKIDGRSIRDAAALLRRRYETVRSWIADFDRSMRRAALAEDLDLSTLVRPAASNPSA